MSLLHKTDGNMDNCCRMFHNGAGNMQDDDVVSLYNCGRRWNYFPRTADRGADDKCKFESFKVMSFNSLAQSLVDSKYLNNDVEIMEWMYRRQEIANVVMESESDVVSLQEIDEEDYKCWFQGYFSDLGYDSVYKQKCNDRVDGVLLLYKRDRFEMLFEKSVEYTCENEDYNRGQVALIVALRDKLTTDLNGSLIDDLYIFANTHIIFNKGRGDIKFYQLFHLLNEIYGMKERCNEYLQEASKRGENDLKNMIPPSIVICGDFNITPQSLIYHFLSHGFAYLNDSDIKCISGQYLMFDDLYITSSDGHLESGNTVGSFKHYLADLYKESAPWHKELENNIDLTLFKCRPEWIDTQILKDFAQLIKKTFNFQQEYVLYCPFKLKSAYNNHFDGEWIPGLDNEPAYTAHHGWQKGCVDYIWHDQHILAEAIYEMPPYNTVKNDGNLPNKVSLYYIS